MPVICADHECIFSHATPDQVRYIVADLASYEESAAFDKVIGKPRIDAIEPAAELVDNPGNPCGRSFDKSESRELR